MPANNKDSGGAAPTINCRECHKPFVPGNGKHRFCGRLCTGRAYYKERRVRVGSEPRLSADEIAQVLVEVRKGRKYIEIALEWLISERAVSGIAVRNGIRRHARKYPKRGAGALSSDARRRAHER